jgi:hypothetical protein
MSSAQDRGAGYAEGRPVQTGGTTGTSQPAPGYSGQAGYSGHRARRGSGAALAGMWLAATLMILSGLLSFLVGLSILIRRAFYGTLPSYAFRWNVHSWGWGELILGIVVFAAGSCLLLGMMWARILGIVLAVISAAGNFVFLPYYPVWSIVVIAIDVFIIWALARGFDVRDEYP